MGSTEQSSIPAGTPAPASASSGLPYWQVNVPVEERTAECPDFLRNITPRDRSIIETPNDQYRASTWPEVQAAIQANRLDSFQRSPVELRRYLAYSWQLKQDWGTVVNFMLKSRLHWSEDEAKTRPDPSSKGDPFADPTAYTILRNDWPYGIDERVVHLVVWTKFALGEDPETGDLTEAGRAAIEAFMEAKFGELPRDRYIWFKNWARLKSVPAVEHFHVMVYDAPPGFIDKMTNGDVALSAKLAGSK